MIRIKPNYPTDIDYVDYIYSYTDKNGYLKVKYYDMICIMDGPTTCIDVKNDTSNMISSIGLGDTFLYVLSKLCIRISQTDKIDMSNIKLTELLDNIQTFYIDGQLSKFIYDKINNNCERDVFVIYKMMNKSIIKVLRYL